MFELQEFLTSFLIPLLVEEEVVAPVYIGWEDHGEVNLLLNPHNVIIIIMIS